MAHFDANVPDSASVIWTLNQEQTPIYAVQPMGAFAANVYERLREFLRTQLTEGVERVSVPGFIAGSVSLLNGQIVPTIVPELRGMYSWSTSRLVEAVAGPRPRGEEQRAEYQQKSQDIENFLERVYYELRNLGIAPQERAMNYAATNAFQVASVFRDAIQAGMKLDTIGVERSPIGRPGSDCWDVNLTFFNPSRRLEQARRVYRFTADVSDVIPVTVGKVRHWDVY
jgi:cyanobactin maturation PatA/PatG family protease